MLNERSGAEGFIHDPFDESVTFIMNISGPYFVSCLLKGIVEAFIVIPKQR
jgi:hypothetical protein